MWFSVVKGVSTYSPTVTTPSLTLLLFAGGLTKTGGNTSAREFGVSTDAINDRYFVILSMNANYWVNTNRWDPILNYPGCMGVVLRLRL